jgi:hypothetical protein
LSGSLAKRATLAIGLSIIVEVVTSTLGFILVALAAFTIKPRLRCAAGSCHSDAIPAPGSRSVPQYEVDVAELMPGISLVQRGSICTSKVI